ncbi:MAG: hypothetical protein ACE5DX_04805 [Candidatus Dojkabacteria bacterium]
MNKISKISLILFLLLTSFAYILQVHSGYVIPVLAATSCVEQGNDCTDGSNGTPDMPHKRTFLRDRSNEFACFTDEAIVDAGGLFRFVDNYSSGGTRYNRFRGCAFVREEEAPDVIARVMETESDSLVPHDEDVYDEDSYRCCPANAPLALENGGKISCCPEGSRWVRGDVGRSVKYEDGRWKNDRTEDINTRNDYCLDYNREPVDGVRGDYKIRDIIILGSLSDIDGFATGFTCPSESSCSILSDDTPGDPNAEYPDEDACGQCYADREEGSVDLGSGVETRVCFNGQWIETDDIPDASVEGCFGIEEEAELAACQTCLENNSGGTVGFVWTGLGCVDTTRDGLITRIFQIGVGLIGGIMIVMFIAAAFKMQTDNPEEIREAREMITSAIIALIILIGAVVILRFLGINVLGILPGDFLG